jgi:hypothetical protein
MSIFECKEIEEQHSMLPTEVLSMQPAQANSIPQFLSGFIISVPMYMHAPACVRTCANTHVALHDITFHYIPHIQS